MPRDEKASYPMLPPKTWWLLRKRFQQSIPKKVTAGYLSTVLQITEKSARANVLPFLRVLGIIDDEEKATKLANKWRFDKDYKEVCDTIRKQVYPRELLDAIPGPIDEKAPVERWFANKTGAGVVAAGKMARLYILLTGADPTKADKAPRPKPTKAAPKRIKKIEPHTKTVGDEETASRPPVGFQPPAVHIDVQIHLSPEAPPDQIDKVFESMAKHLKALYGRSKKNS